MPHWFDKPLRVQSMDRFRGVTGICMKMLPPSSCGMPLVTAASCGFLRDGIEERGERREGRGEVGMFPLPQRNTFPLPTGVDSRSIQCQGCASPHPVPGEKLPEDPVSSPCTAIRTIAMHCPPPLRGREEAAERPGGGGDPRKPFNQRCGRQERGFQRERFSVPCRDRGGGCSTPLPVSPSPTGVIPHLYGATGEVLSAVMNTLPKSFSCSPCTVSGSIAKHLPAPSGGGGRRPRSGRVVGVICLTRKRSVWLRRRRQAVGVIIHLHGATGLLRQRTFPGEVLERWDGGARRPLAHIPPRLTDSVSSCRRAPSRS